MQLLTELLDLQRQEHFLAENLSHLKELGLGRMVNAFKMSFAQAGHGNTSRLTPNKAGDTLQSRASGIGEHSESVDMGPVRQWARVKRDIVQFDDTRVAGLLFKVDEKPVSLVITGPGWKMSNIRAVVGQAWDFTNVSAPDEDIEQVLMTLDHKHKKVDDENVKKRKLKVREYVGHAQSMADIQEFVKKAVEAFGNRLHYTIITRDEPKKEKKPGEKAAEKKAEVDKKSAASEKKTAAKAEV